MNIIYLIKNVLLLTAVSFLFLGGNALAAVSPTGSSLGVCPSTYRSVYVALSGDDSKQGLKPDQAVKSLERAKAIALAEKNQSDGFCILLKKGDTFTDFKNNTSVLFTENDARNFYAFLWDINKPLFFSSYGEGDSLPVLYQSGSTANRSLPPRSFGLLNVDASTTIKGIRFKHWPSGAIYSANSKNITIEENIFEEIGTKYFGSRDKNYTAGVIYTEDTSNLIARNNLMRDMHNSGVEMDDLHAFYLNRSSNFLIADNTIYRTSGSPLKFRRGLTTDINIDNNSFYYTGPAKGQSNVDQFGFVRYSGDSSSSNCPSRITITNNKFYYPYCSGSSRQCSNKKAIRCTNSNPNPCGGVCTNEGFDNAGDNYGDSRSKITWTNNDFKSSWSSLSLSDTTGPNIEISTPTQNSQYLSVNSASFSISGAIVDNIKVKSAYWKDFFSGLGGSLSNLANWQIGPFAPKEEETKIEITAFDWLGNYTKKYLSFSACVPEGKSLGLVSDDNHKVCCDGLVEEINENSSSLYRGVCSRPQTQEISNPDVSIFPNLNLSPSSDLKEGDSVTVTVAVNDLDGVSASSIPVDWSVNGSTFTTGTLANMSSITIPGSSLFVGRNSVYFKIEPPASLNEQNTWNNFSEAYFNVKTRVTVSEVPHTLTLNVNNQSTGFIVGGKNGAQGINAIEFNCGQQEEIANAKIWPASSCSQTYPHGTVITLIASKTGILSGGKAIVRGTFSGWGNNCTSLTTWTGNDGVSYPACQIRLESDKTIDISFTQTSSFHFQLEQLGNAVLLIKSLVDSLR